MKHESRSISVPKHDHVGVSSTAVRGRPVLTKIVPWGHGWGQTKCRATREVHQSGLYGSANGGHNQSRDSRLHPLSLSLYLSLFLPSFLFQSQSIQSSFVCDCIPTDLTTSFAVNARLYLEFHGLHMNSVASSFAFTVSATTNTLKQKKKKKKR